MKTKALNLLIGVFFFIPLSAQQRGELVFDSLLHYYDPVEISVIYDGFDLPELLFPVNYGVEMYKVVYRTPAATGDSLTLASGLVTVPVNSSCSFPMMVYNHGSLPYDSTISELNARFEQHLFGIPFSANGYISALPDYLGYGATPIGHPHPYLHAGSGATAVIDMLRAARELCGKIAVDWDGQLFLLGYSQGGHVAMATHRELEAFHAGEFNVTASAPCSGPYDLSGISRDSLLFTDRFAHPFFITFASLSYQYVYGNLYEELEDIFLEPYPNVIRRIFNRQNPESSLLSALPYPAIDMLDPLFYENVVNDPEHPLNRDLRDNDVYDWVPRAPVRLFYCAGDERVPFNNALFTAQHMTDRGAPDVQAIMAGERENHEDCTYPSIVYAKIWFDQFRIACSTPTDEIAGSDRRAYVYPNPFYDYVCIAGRYEELPDRVLIYDLFGRLLRKEELNGKTLLPISGTALTAGNYLFVLQGKERSYRQMMIKAE